MSPSPVSPARQQPASSNYYAILATVPNNYGLDAKAGQNKHHHHPASVGDNFVHLKRSDDSFVQVKVPKNWKEENDVPLSQADDSFIQINTPKNKPKNQPKEESWTLLNAPLAKSEANSAPSQAKPTSWLKRWVPGLSGH